MDDQPGPARPLARLAIELARRTDDSTIRGQAALRAVRNQLSGRVPDDDAWSELDELRLVAANDGDVAVRVQAWVTLADVAFVRHDDDEGQRCSARATTLADESGDAQLRALAHYAEGLQQLGRLDVQAARDSLSRSVELSEARSVVRSWAVVRRSIAEFISGDLSVAGAHVDHAIAHTTDRRHWADRSLAEAYRAGVLTLRGQLSEAESCAQVALRLFAWAGYEPTLRIALTQLICIRALRGEDQAIVTTLERENSRWVATTIVGAGSDGSHPRSHSGSATRTGPSTTDRHGAIAARARRSRRGLRRCSSG